MEDFVIYLLKVNLAVSLLFFSFLLFFKSEQSFQMNRFLLLGIFFVSFILPGTPSVKNLFKNVKVFKFQLKNKRALHFITLYIGVNSRVLKITKTHETNNNSKK